MSKSESYTNLSAYRKRNYLNKLGASFTKEQIDSIFVHTVNLLIYRTYKEIVKNPFGFYQNNLIVMSTSNESFII